jgi:general secretion pathway protein A
MLERPDLEQLAQRVIARFHLKALSEKETEHYIRHRLSVAGMTRAIPFERKALQRIHEIARGVPRRINLLCDRVMLGAYAHGKHTIDAAMVEKAGREVFGRLPNSTPPDRMPRATGTGLGVLIGGGLAIAALAAFALYSGWRQGNPPTAVAVATPAAAAASAPASAASAAEPTSAQSTTSTPAATASPAAVTTPATRRASTTASSAHH